MSKAINFGVGTVIGRRTDVANPTPSFMGILQEIEIDFDQTLKELVGQQKFAVDVAPAMLKITGKAKFARIQAGSINNLLIGQTLTTAAGIKMAVAENHSVPATPGPYTVVVTQAATYSADLGVFYASNGAQLTRVASGSEALGKYSVNETTGTYTFDAADQAVSMNFYYEYGVATDNQVTINNVNMGTGPSFALFLSESYIDNDGNTNTINLKLNACRSSKLTLPFKNQDYTIMDTDFQAFADSAGVIGTLAISS